MPAWIERIVCRSCSEVHAYSVISVFKRRADNRTYRSTPAVFIVGLSAWNNNSSYTFEWSLVFWHATPSSQFFFLQPHHSTYPTISMLSEILLLSICIFLFAIVSPTNIRLSLERKVKQYHNIRQEWEINMTYNFIMLWLHIRITSWVIITRRKQVLALLVFECLEVINNIRILNIMLESACIVCMSIRGGAAPSPKPSLEKSETQYSGILISCIFWQKLKTYSSIVQRILKQKPFPLSYFFDYCLFAILDLFIHFCIAFFLSFFFVSFLSFFPFLFIPFYLFIY